MGLTRIIHEGFAGGALLGQRRLEVESRQLKVSDCTNSNYGRLVSLLGGCVLVEFLFGRFLARAGFFIPKSGATASIYNTMVFASLVALNLSSVLVYPLVALRAVHESTRIYINETAGDLRRFAGYGWRLIALTSVSLLAFLNLLRIMWPFGLIVGTVYQLLFLIALLSCVGIVLSESSLRWWALPALLVFLSQLCAKLFVISQNLGGISGTFPLRLYQAGELIFLASIWAFFGVTVIQNGSIIIRKKPSAGKSPTDEKTLRIGIPGRTSTGFFNQRIVAVASAVSILCGAGMFVLCMLSPYPRQMIMFATGLTMFPAGAPLCALSLSAAMFGLVLLIGEAGTRHIGICFFLVMACGYDIEMTHYYLLAVLGLWLISDFHQPDTSPLM